MDGEHKAVMIMVIVLITIIGVNVALHKGSPSIAEAIAHAIEEDRR